MKKAKCQEGHFFDLDRFPVCPVCGKPGAELGRTRPQEPPPAGAAPRTQLLWRPAPEAPAEPAAPKQAKAAPPAPPPAPPDRPDGAVPEDLPAAWLVGLGGPYLGRAFPCKTGRTRIGRSEGMDISLSEAPSVSEGLHASVIYEPVKGEFFLQAGTGGGLTYRNGTPVFSHDTLHPYDRIGLGKAEFVFLPLCGEHFSWQAYLNQE